MSWEQLHGWFDWQWLYERAVREAPPDAAIVEVGAWRFRSFAFLCRQAIIQERSDLFLYAVDPFRVEDWMLRDEPDFMRGLKVGDSFFPRAIADFRVLATEEYDRMASRGFIFPGTSSDTDYEPWLVYIDGDHTQAGVEADIDVWLPRVAKGGIIAGHDFGNFGVEPAVRKKFGDAFEVLGSTWMVRR